MFGLLSQDNQLTTYSTDQKISSEFVIASLDHFLANQADKVTLLVLDNASIHVSKTFRAACQRWEEKALVVWYLPTYSPHLNRMERRWLRMKYSWLKAPDYNSMKTLKEALKRIFDQFAGQYTINFSTKIVSIISL